MPLAFHSIFSMYGFWLPNDPRGSGSDYIAAWELFRYGRATKTDSRQSVAHASHDSAKRLAAKHALRYPSVEITGHQALSLATGFTIACQEADYRIHACAILPDHIHLVVGVHRRGIRQIVGHLKSRATRQLKDDGRWHSDGRPVWGAHGWNVYLDDIAAVDRAIAYVNDNPIKERKKPQSWQFVTELDLALATSASQATRLTRRIGGAALASSLAKRARSTSSRRPPK